MKQNTWEPINDKWTRPIDMDGIFLGQFTVCAKRLQEGVSRRTKSATIAIAL